jgi:peptidoglycan/LPS O-acetylase OafA/YrhL
VCAAISVALIEIPNGVRFSGLPVAYLTVYLGLLSPPRNSLVLSGDYSYGLYLYGYPLQQAVVTATPSLKLWYWNLLLSIPLAFAIAICSWWLVERPCLRGKHLLDKFESWRATRRVVHASS